nr:hypothetical protein [Kibdelosporangium sp. MJ126-NF4]
MRRVNEGGVACTVRDTGAVRAGTGPARCEIGVSVTGAGPGCVGVVITT